MYLYHGRVGGTDGSHETSITTMSTPLLCINRSETVSIVHQLIKAIRRWTKLSKWRDNTPDDQVRSTDRTRHRRHQSVQGPFTLRNIPEPYLTDTCQICHEEEKLSRLLCTSERTTRPPIESWPGWPSGSWRPHWPRAVYRAPIRVTRRNGNTNKKTHISAYIQSVSNEINGANAALRL